MCVFWALVCARKCVCGWGSAPDPIREASSTPPLPLTSGKGAQCFSLLLPTPICFYAYVSVCIMYIVVLRVMRGLYHVLLWLSRPHLEYASTVWWWWWWIRWWFKVIENNNVMLLLDDFDLSFLLHWALLPYSPGSFLLLKLTSFCRLTTKRLKCIAVDSN